MAKNIAKEFSGASMTADGMLYNGFVCKPVVEKCEGCERSLAFEGQQFCSIYPLPAPKWDLGRCNMATHVKKETKSQGKVNPLKASKRASKGK